MLSVTISDSKLKTSTIGSRVISLVNVVGMDRSGSEIYELLYVMYFKDQEQKAIVTDFNCMLFRLETTVQLTEVLVYVPTLMHALKIVCFGSCKLPVVNPCNS